MEPVTKYSDRQLLDGVTHGNPQILRYIYTEVYPGIRHYVLLNSGNEADAKDIFQETMVVLYRKIKEPEFQLSSSLSTFLYGIGKYIWLKEISNRKKHNIIEDESETLFSEEKEVLELIERNDRLRLYREKFEELSDNCKRIIKMFLNNIPIKDVTQSMGYSSDQHTKNRHFRCKKSLISKIQECNKFKELGNG